MFDDGKAKVYRKVHGKTESGRPVFELEYHGDAWYGDINFTTDEWYRNLQSLTKERRRIRSRADCLLGMGGKRRKA